MNKLILLPALFLSVVAYAQNLTGLYTGTLFNDTTKLTQNYELALKDDGKNITGTSYTTFVLDDQYYFGLRTLKGYKKDGKLILEEVSLLENNFPVAPPKGIRRMAVIPINDSGEIELLNGMWQTNRTKQFKPVTGLINLRKDEETAKSALMSYLQEKKPVQFQNDMAYAKAKTAELKKSEEKTSYTPDVAIVATNKEVPKKEAVVTAPPPKETKPVETVVAKQEEIKQPEKKDAVVIVQEKPKPKDTEPPPVYNADGDLVIVRPRSQEKPQVTKPPVVEEKKKPETVVVNTDKPAEEKPKQQVVVTKPADRVVITPEKKEKTKGEKKKDVAVTANAKPFTERSTRVLQTVVVTADSLQLSLYDNGVVDGDVVSVYVNGVNVIESVKLTGRAFRKTILAPRTNSILEIKLVAENLGSLPPNTGLMIIQDKDSKYHVNFSADMDTNASIIVRKE
jgi:hypothetical protein